MVDDRDGAPPDAVVVVGASAGGVEALSRLVGDLDPQIGVLDHPDFVVGLARMGAAVKEGVERVRALPVEEPREHEQAAGRARELLLGADAESD